MVEALNKSGHEEVAKEVVKQLLKNYSKVNLYVLFLHKNYYLAAMTYNQVQYFQINHLAGEF